MAIFPRGEPEVSFEDAPAQLQVTVEGDFNLNTAHPMDSVKQKILSRLQRNPAGKVVLNFSSIAAINSDTLGKIVGLDRELKRMNIALEISGLNETIREEFRVTKLDRILNIADEGNFPSQKKKADV